MCDSNPVGATLKDAESRIKKELVIANQRFWWSQIRGDEVERTLLAFVCAKKTPFGSGKVTLYAEGSGFALRGCYSQAAALLQTQFFCTLQKEYITVKYLGIYCNPDYWSEVHWGVSSIGYPQPSDGIGIPKPDPRSPLNISKPDPRSPPNVLKPEPRSLPNIPKPDL
jgi:hypothetical protein